MQEIKLNEYLLHISDNFMIDKKLEMETEIYNISTKTGSFQIRYNRLTRCFKILFIEILFNELNAVYTAGFYKESVFNEIALLNIKNKKIYIYSLDKKEA